MIVNPVSSASPDMDPDDFQRLKDSIATLGQLVPILLSGGEVIDGRKRMRACEELGIEPKALETSGAAADVAEAANLLRTHYTPSQRAMFASRLATLKRGQVGGNHPRSPNLVSLTHREAAERLGVATGAVIEAKAIRRDAAPEVVEAVERGHLTLHAAREIVKALPREAQAAKAAEIAAAPAKHRKKVATSLGASTFRRLPKKSAADVLSRCVDSIEAAAQTIEATERTKFRAAEAQDWAERLNLALPVIRTFLKEIEAVYGKRHA